VKGKYFPPITSIAPKLTTTTEIDVDSSKICSIHEFDHGCLPEPHPWCDVVVKKSWEVSQNLAVI
jgi:hypothetical protein